MTTKKNAELYLLWDGEEHLQEGDSVLTTSTPDGITEGDMLDVMNYCNNDALYLYKLVPIRKYERQTGVRTTELKGALS